MVSFNGEHFLKNSAALESFVKGGILVFNDNVVMDANL